MIDTHSGVRMVKPRRSQKPWGREWASAEAGAEPKRSENSSQQSQSRDRQLQQSSGGADGNRTRVESLEDSRVTTTPQPRGCPDSLP